VLMPMWMLSGSLFPVSGAAGWLAWVMRLNPLTYGVEAVRTSLHLSGPPAQWHLASTLLPSLAVTTVFCIVTFAASTLLVGRRSPASYS